MSRALVFALIGGLLLAGCSMAGSDDAEQANGKKPGLVWHECADEVDLALTTEHRCGTLTVPPDHSRSGGHTLGLSVLEVQPADGARDGEAALSVGFNFGEPRMAPSDMFALAERIGVPVVALAPRGVGEGGGIPLDCPELDGLDTGALTQPDAAPRGAFLDAVTACHDRLVSDGVDLDLFGVDDIAEDVEDLRSSLGVGRWYAMISYGELSRVSDTYAASYGDHVRAIVEDSPAPTGRDSFAAGAEGLRSAVDALFTECARDRVCARRYPDLGARWQQALERVAAKPLSGTGPNGPVLVDAPKFLRAVRAMLGNGPGFVANLPRIIVAAAEGQLHPTLTSVLGTDSAYCLGHRPICAKPDFSMGAYLSQACPELGADDSVEDDPRYREVFVDSPYVDACEVWDVEASEPPEAAEVPTLVLTGDLDSWSRPEWFDDAVVIRGAAHDVAGSSECVFDVRNPWIADPTTPPDQRPCDTEPFPQWD